MTRKRHLVMALVVGGVCSMSSPTLRAAASTNSFVNFETPPVHPLALSPDGHWLAVCNLPDDRLELFELDSGLPVSIGRVSVGINPVSVRFRADDEIWVVNHISDSISVVGLNSTSVVATIDTLDAPADVVFAGNPTRAFVTCSGANMVQVFDPVTRIELGRIAIDGQRPKAMAVSPDGQKVYAAIFESGNRTTILSAGVGPLTSFPQPTVIDFPDGPHQGQNPPPNRGTNFAPNLNPALPTNALPPRVGMIVRKDKSGKWTDDNNGDWTEFVNGTNSVFSGRPQGWDLADHDVAVIDAATLSATYLTGLMNICMDIAVNPASGNITVVGTDAMNHLRFEPVLNGIFVRVELAQVSQDGKSNIVSDLNPHLDYSTPTVPESERHKSIGDPRAVVWRSDGTRGYVAGMGSGNLIIIDAAGNRVGSAVDVGDGPAGLCLDEVRGRLYVLNRFSNSMSVVDTETDDVLATITLFDPTPEVVKTGRKHLYDTHKTSGLGQAACASCHVDARFDRLAWDLGDPTGSMKAVTLTNSNFGRFPPDPTNNFHPMKGPMVTQTLQDIIGHEPFHWRGDREGLEQFNATFTNLQGAASGLTTNEMSELKGFLASVTFPPNPFRRFDNSLSTNLSLPGHFALGRGSRRAGEPLPNGNAQSGLNRFRQQGNPGCTHCHTLPSGIGPDLIWTGTQWRPFPVGPDSRHHAALIALQRSSRLPFKIASLRNLSDKMGMDLLHESSRSGFGLFHDGSVDSLTRFIQDSFDFRDDQETADMVAFLLSFTGSDLPSGSNTDPDRPPGSPSRDVAAAVGKQITIDDPSPVQLITDMLALAASPTGRVDLVVHGQMDGIIRGWVFDRTRNQFQSDRNGETIATSQIRLLAATNNPLTYTVVPRGLGIRMGVDQDEDGYFDRTEIEFGSDPLDPLSLATNTPPIVLAVADQSVAAGNVLKLTISATDDDRPVQALTFSIDPPLPEGAGIDSTTGMFSWQPLQRDALKTYRITVRVSDNGKPIRSTTTSFNITVGQHPFAPQIASVSIGTGGNTIRWNAFTGKNYQLQFKNALTDADWTDLGTVVTADSESMSAIDQSPGSPQERYYRILLIE